MANTPLQVEVTVADLPQVQKVFVAVAEVARSVRELTMEEMERLPTPLLKALEKAINVTAEIDHSTLTAQEGAFRQKIANLIGNAGAGTVEVSDLRRAMEGK